MASWTAFYMALANAMTTLSTSELFEKVKNLAAGNEGLDYLHLQTSEMWFSREMDPFTVLGIFNRGQTDAHRAALGTAVAAMLDVSLPAPQCYSGIPHLDPRKSIYDGPNAMRELFLAALHGPDNAAFPPAWDKAIAIHGNGLGTLSIGLFWIRPYDFMAVDRISAPWLLEHFGISSPAEKCSGQEYVVYLDMLKRNAAKASLDYPSITYAAFEQKHPGKSC